MAKAVSGQAVCSEGDERKGRGKVRAKDYLRQLEKLDTIIQNKLIEKEQCREIAMNVTSHLGGERVQSSGSQQKMSDAVDRLVDLENEIDRCVERLLALKMEATEIIEQLNTAEYDVLHKLYIQGMTFDEVALIKQKSKSWVTTVHGRALKNMGALLEERNI